MSIFRMSLQRSGLKRLIGKVMKISTNSPQGLEKRFCVLLSGMFLILFGVLLNIESAGAQSLQEKALQKILDDYLESEVLSGGVLLLSMPGQRIVVASGVANRETGAPVKSDSRFYVASVGKMAVAAATQQLVEEGKLSLNASAASLVGNIPNIGKLPNARIAKLSQLLDHSSGIPDYLTDAFSEFYHARTARLTPAIALPYAFDEPATGKPGAAFEYSNSNYVLLGDIIAKADGMPFEAALQKRVLDPVGMSETTVGAKPGSAKLAHGYADPEDAGNEQDVSLAAWNSPLGDGPLVTTVGDLEKFVFALFRDRKILKDETLERMIAPSAQDEEYGMGVQIGATRWGDWLGHDGLEDGFEAEVRYYPEHQAAIIFVTNGNTIADEYITDKVAAALVKAQRSERKLGKDAESGSSKSRR
ncbi:Beta-lactamase family protein [Rhodospirillaceae bacterium LM-1]|nr:Beta-lactamase family protein [Rhodospirillaceae bacterium LM-1]